MRPQPIILADAVRLLASNPSHLLFCDTCALLDIIRLPMRELTPAKLSRTLAAISSIESKLASRQVALICPEPIPLEWDNNVRQVVNETTNHVNSLVRAFDIFTVLAQTQGITLNPCPVTTSAIVTFIHDLSERLLDSSVIIKKDDTVSLRATNRAVLSTPPGRRGAVKDCIIYEHMLEIFSLLPPQALGIKRVFLTSNVNDFCIGNSKPRPPIDTELSRHNATLCTSWNSADRQI